MFFKGWKTIVFAALVAAASFLASDEVAQWVAQNLPEVGGGLAGAIAVLRWLTTSPIFKED